MMFKNKSCSRKVVLILYRGVHVVNSEINENLIPIAKFFLIAKFSNNNWDIYVIYKRQDRLLYHPASRKQRSIAS